MVNVRPTPSATKHVSPGQTRVPRPIRPIRFSDMLKADVQQGKFVDKTRQSTRWYQAQARQFKGMDPSAIMQGEKAGLKNQARPGKMVMFFYDPKLKKELPYYDRFPCGFIVDGASGGRFHGVNLHYIAPPLRARLFDALMELEVGDKPEAKRLELSYAILRQTQKLRAFKPCYKTYLVDHVRSRFLEVPREAWQLALMLPLARFEKKSGATVWRESAKKMDRDKK